MIQPHFIKIETDRLKLRMPRLEDFESYAAFCASDRARFEFAKPLSRDEAWAQFGKDIAGWTLRGYGPWSIEVKKTGAYIGEIGIFHPASYPLPELGWSITEPSAEGKGYAHEAAQAVLSTAGDDWEWTQLVNYIDPENKRSRTLAERLGGVVDTSLPIPSDETPETCMTYRYDLGATA